MRGLVASRPVQVTVLGWIALSVLLGLGVVSRGLPFLDRLPIFRGMDALDVLKAEQLNAAFGLVILALVGLITRGRKTALSAPEKITAHRELKSLLAYLLIAQIAGYAFGRWLGIHPISLHLPGTLFGLFDRVSQFEVIVWSVFNFVVYAALPYLYFRGKGYANTDLNLRSKDPAKDWILILVVLLVEGIGELGGFSHALFDLTPRQLAIGGSLAFVANLFGTGLPIMVFVYALLLPRYIAVTGSPVAAALLGGCTYALVHFFEAWTDHTSLFGRLPQRDFSSCNISFQASSSRCSPFAQATHGCTSGAIMPSRRMCRLMRRISWRCSALNSTRRSEPPLHLLRGHVASGQDRADQLPHEPRMVSQYRRQACRARRLQHKTEFVQ